MQIKRDVHPGLVITILLSVVLSFPLETTSAQEMGHLTGRVTDARTDSALARVNIWIPGTDFGTITDDNGEFDLMVAPGTHTVNFNYIGYTRKTRKITIRRGSTLQMKVELQVKPLELRGIVVEEERGTQYLDTHYRVSTSTARSVPPLAEPDIFGALRTLPGIIQTNDLTGNLYVRGGAADQNMILLDGVKIYNPYHLFGLFSGINIWAVGSFDVYPAEFPVKYSGKLSSVIDIRTKDPRETEETVVNLSLLSSSLSLSKSFENRSLLVAFRRTYLDLIGPLLGFDIPYRFYDTNLKFKQRLSEHTDFKVWGYYSRDVFDPAIRRISDLERSVRQVNNRWGNAMAAAQVTRNTGNTTSRISVSTSRNYLRMKEEEKYEVNNLIRRHTLKGDGIQEHGWHVFHFGFYLKRITMNYQWDGNYTVEEIFYEDIPRDIDYDSERYHYGLYWQEDLTVFSDFLLSAGLAWDHWGGKEVFSPRVNLKWQRDEYTTFKVGYGVYYQPLSQGAEPQEGSVSAPVFPNDHLSRSDSYSMSFTRELNRYFDLSVEFYHRRFSNIVEIRTDSRFPSFTYGSGTTTGLDLMLKRGAGDFTYQITGSLLRNRVTFAENAYPPHWDTPYHLNALASWHPGAGYSITLQSWLQSGTPYTPVTEKYLRLRDIREGNTPGDLWVDFVHGPRNSARYTDYVRLDLGAKKQGTWGPADYEVYVQILNLLNTQNIIRYQWYNYYYNQAAEDEGPDSGEGRITGLPIIPSLGVVLKF